MTLALHRRDCSLRRLSYPCRTPLVCRNRAHHHQKSLLKACLGTLLPNYLRLMKRFTSISQVILIPRSHTRPNWPLSMIDPQETRAWRVQEFSVIARHLLQVWPRGWPKRPHTPNRLARLIRRTTRLSRIGARRHGANQCLPASMMRNHWHRLRRTSRQWLRHPSKA